MVGLLTDSQFTCALRMGSSSTACSARTTDNAALVSQCIQGRSLQLTNSGGTCLQTWMPSAQHIDLGGDRSVEIMFGEDALPSSINVAFTTSNSPVPCPNATRLLLRFSTLPVPVARPVVISGQLPFEVPGSGASVIISGWDVAALTTCNVVDRTGRRVCRLEPDCVRTAAQARESLQRRQALQPCSRP